jgi:hypothetical protein
MSNRWVDRHTLALTIAVLLAGAGCSAWRQEKGTRVMETKVRGRTGTKQGPLLMGDDFARELRGRVRGVEAARTCALADRLAALRAPAAASWRFPDVPRSARAQVSTPPFRAGCRTVGIGTGPVDAKAFKGRRGAFDVLCAAGPGQYSYTVSSPCIHYTAPSDGWVSIEFTVLLSGRIEVAPGKSGRAGVEVGLYAAHCWPKEAGKYWQASVFAYDEAMAATLKGGLPFSHRAVFPVKRGVRYSFGAGLTTQAWARDGAAAGCRLSGRLAHVVIRKVKAPPAELPYWKAK